jgi:hypothetical protein
MGSKIAGSTMEGNSEDFAAKSRKKRERFIFQHLASFVPLSGYSPNSLRSLCAFAPLRETTWIVSRKGAKAQRIAKKCKAEGR